MKDTKEDEEGWEDDEEDEGEHEGSVSEEPGD